MTPLTPLAPPRRRLGLRLPSDLLYRIRHAWAALHAADPKRYPSVNAYITEVLAAAVPDTRKRPPGYGVGVDK